MLAFAWDGITSFSVRPIRLVSLIGAIVGEYMGAAAGFGWMVAYATSYFRMKRVMSCIVILLLVGLILNFVLDKIESLLLKWRPATTLNVGADRESA